MLQAFRLQQGDASLSYPQMKDALGEPVSLVPREREASATGAGWWLRSVVSTGYEGREAVESTFIHVAAGRKAHEHRTTDAFTEYDGHVPAAGPVLDPCASDRSFSVTDLETAASCPFRFFLKRGLGLRPVDERERDKDVWLDPLTRGSALHDIYAALHRRCRGEKRRPDVKKDGGWLRDLAQAQLASLQEEMPASTGEVFDRESRAFLEDVDLFLAGECEPGDAEPIGFEVSFGRPLDDDAEPLARAEAVEIDLGGGHVFRIAGRIDRIDQVGESQFRIVDYKTGGFWRDDWKGVFNRGRRLQHALYGLAAVELLRAKHKKPKITEGVYYFSTHKGGRRRHRIAAPTAAETSGVLSDLRDLIVGGAFVHAPDKDACKFCDYTAACDASAKENAAGKLEDPKLAAYGRLAEHA